MYGGWNPTLFGSEQEAMTLRLGVENAQPLKWKVVCHYYFCVCIHSSLHLTGTFQLNPTQAIRRSCSQHKHHLNSLWRVFFFTSSLLFRHNVKEKDSYIIKWYKWAFSSLSRCVWSTATRKNIVSWDYGHEILPFQQQKLNEQVLAYLFCFYNVVENCFSER